MAMKRGIRLTLNTVGIALLISLLKSLIDIFLVLNHAYEYSDFVLTPVIGYMAIGIAASVVAFWTGYRNALGLSYIYFWLQLGLFNLNLAFRAYEHSPLTLLLLMLIAPLPAVIFALIGGWIGKLLRSLFGRGNNQ